MDIFAKIVNVNIFAFKVSSYLSDNVLYTSCVELRQVLFKHFSGTYSKQVHSGPYKPCKMESFIKIMNDFKPLTFSTKSFILDVWLGSEYPTAIYWAWLFLVLYNFRKSAVNHLSQSLSFNNHCVKSVCIRSYSGPHFFLIFSIWVFFHDHSRITRLQGKGEGISFTPHYHFHPLYRHLDSSQTITAESSPLHIASSWTRTGTFGFRAQVANH